MTTIGAGISFGKGIVIEGLFPPTPPTIGTATATSGTTATVTYTEPSNNGNSPIVSYTAVSNPGNITGTVSQSGSGTITVTGLTKGTTYTFTVYATTSYSDGPSSGSSNSVTPATVPDAPTVGTPTVASSTSVTVPFTAPTDNGGRAITSYTAVSSPGNITGTVSQSGSGTITVTGLTKGTSYTFTVYATNPIGNSSDSSASSAVIPATVPNAPTVGTPTVASGTSVNVPFTAPADNGGRTITSYTAVSSPGNITGTISQSGSGTITVTGLTKGTSYTFTVYATNPMGNSSSSSASSAVIPSTVPGAPTIGTASSAGGSSVTVTFTAPADNGGRTITSYTAVSSPGGITGSVSQSGSGSITVNGLSYNTSYTFTVYATNPVGNGSSSSASNAITLTNLTAIVDVPSNSVIVQQDANYTPVTVSGGTAPYTFSVSPALPTNMQLNTANGFISNSAIANSASRSYQMTITDSLGASTSGNFTLAVTTSTTVGNAFFGQVLGNVTQVSGPFTWTVPADVYSVSVVAVGGGGAGSRTTGYGGGGGGALAYINNYKVTPGQVIDLEVGSRGVTTTNGTASWFSSTSLVYAGGGQSGQTSTGGTGGTYTVSTVTGSYGGGNGGNGGSGGASNRNGGGGGAGGYAGNGGTGGSGTPTSGSSAATGSGGGGGGGGSSVSGSAGGAGSGVGVVTKGATGAGGAGSASSTGAPGTGGSGGENYLNNGVGGYGTQNGGKYGGGGGGAAAAGGSGGQGAVRIKWPGDTQRYN